MRVFLLFTFLFVSAGLIAQQNDLCANATQLCGGVTYSSSNVNATTVCNGEDGPCNGGLFCFGPNNTVWFTFTTNANGGQASVTISDIVSVNGDDTLQAALLYAAVPCESSGYVIAACENAGTNTFSISSSSLLPNRQYFVVVDGKGSTPPYGESVFNIKVSGPAVEQIVNVTPTPPSSCAAQDGSISATSLPGSTYSLNGGTFQEEGLFEGLGTGSYQLTVRSSAGCDTTINVMLASPVITSAEASTQPSGCTQATGSVMVTNINGGTAPYTFTLNGSSQSDSTFTGLSPGTYAIVVNDASAPGCTFTVYAVIEKEEPVVQTATVNPGCTLPNGSILVSASGAPGPFQFSISPGSGTQTGNTFTATVAVGTYTVIATSSNGCSDTAIVVVSERSPITGLNYSTQAADCGSSSPGSAQITSVEGGSAPYVYSVDGGAYQSSPSFASLSSGSHTVKVKDAAGCEFEKPLVIPSTGDPECSAGPDKIHYPGTSTVLEGMASEGTYNWSPYLFIDDTTSLTPTVKPLRDTRYTLTVVTASGCVCTDVVLVSVVPPIVPIPNAFSPNSDAANDIWFIPNLEYYDQCIVDVYTRYGQRIFHSDGYERGDEWDGTVAGLPAPAGNYYFVINLNTKVEGFQDLYTGSVLLVR